MRAFKMTAVNDGNVRRIRYCYADNYIEAKKKFAQEYWYLQIENVMECPDSEASIIGAIEQSIG